MMSPLETAYTQLNTIISTAFIKLTEQEPPLYKIEAPVTRLHGDITSNIALTWNNPEVFSHRLCHELSLDGSYFASSNAKNGFLNFRIIDSFYTDVLMFPYSVNPVTEKIPSEMQRYLNYGIESAGDVLRQFECNNINSISKENLVMFMDKKECDLIWHIARLPSAPSLEYAADLTTLFHHYNRSRFPVKPEMQNGQIILTMKVYKILLKLYPPSVN